MPWDPSRANFGHLSFQIGRHYWCFRLLFLNVCYSVWVSTHKHISTCHVFSHLWWPEIQLWTCFQDAYFDVHNENLLVALVADWPAEACISCLVSSATVLALPLSDYALSPLSSKIIDIIVNALYDCQWLLWVQLRPSFSIRISIGMKLWSRKSLGPTNYGSSWRGQVFW